MHHPQTQMVIKIIRLYTGKVFVTTDKLFPVNNIITELLTIHPLNTTNNESVESACVVFVKGANIRNR